MKKFTAKITLFIVILLYTIFAGCTAVKPYQKMYLNDEEMKLSSRSISGFETSVEGYREGATGANGGKTGGGCGCN